MRNPVIRISDQFRYKPGYATKMAGGLKVWIYKVQELYAAKTKALISCAVTTQLICTFVLCIYKKQNFSWLDSTHNPQSRTQNEKKKILGPRQRREKLSSFLSDTESLMSLLHFEEIQ